MPLKPQAFESRTGMRVGGEDEPPFTRRPASGKQSIRRMLSALLKPYKERLQKQTLLTVQQNELRWRSAFESSAIGIAMADFTGRYFRANRAFRNMLGYTESELYQLSFTEVTFEEDRKANQQLLRELVEGKRQHFELEMRYRRKDATLIWVRSNVALVPGTSTVPPFWFNVVEDVTEQKRVEEELRLQLDALRNIPAAVWTVTPEGRCNFINEFFVDATGIEREYIQSPPAEWNKNGSDVPPFFSCVPLDDRQRVAGLFWKGIRTGEGWAFEAKHLHTSDGTYHWCFDRAVPVRDSRGNVLRFVATCADIEPLKQAQQNLRESETRLQIFFENSPNLIFLKDRQGKYVYANRQFKRVFHLTQEEVIGKKDDELFPAEHASAFERNDQQVQDTGAPIEFEEMALYTDGPHASIVHKFPLFNTEGIIYAIGGIVTDITERKKLQEALDATQADLAHVSNMTTMGELAASIAHEVNQPLTAVINNSNACLRLLANNNLAPEVLRRALEEIAADATRASAVIARIRAFIKKAPSEKVKLDIGEVIQEVLALAKPEIHEHRIGLECHLAKSLPLVLGDRVQLQQVLLNLIINGIEAMAAVADRPRLLWIESGAEASGEVFVIVRDSGTGLDLDSDRLFRPLFTTKPNGMGMGLAISRSLIENHGGRLWATPNFPNGAVFSFALPAATRASV